MNQKQGHILLLFFYFNSMASPEKQKIRIMDHEGILAKIRRIAYEIYENNYGQKQLTLVGIDYRGGMVAEILAEAIRSISEIKVQLLSADKVEDDTKVLLKGERLEQALKEQVVIIVDDVLYSGKTLFQALSEIAPYQPYRIQNAVLIDRGHRNIPISPDFVGTDLATTLQQHVSVEVNKKGELKAFLM